MSKSKINPNAKSKISNIVVNKHHENTPATHGFITQNKHKKITKSFRLSSFDLDKLNNLVSKVNKNCPYKNYSESEIMRGLISLGEELPLKKIAKSLEQRVLAD